jgi:hypothetical protein
MIRTLDASKIIATAEKLHARVAERFPGRGLTALASEVVEAGRESAAVARCLGRPMIGFRVVSWTGVAALVGAVVWATRWILDQNARDPGSFGLTEILQAAESAVNEVVFVCVAIFFLVRWERRVKRSRALDMLHKLRSLAHIVDMHQLTKDPDAAGAGARPTASSPVRDLEGYDLKRYFDYCSELLSVISKFAALLVEDFDDPVTLSAVNEIESLTSGLARKIWQKIIVGSTMPAPESEPEPDPEAG